MLAAEASMESFVGEGKIAVCAHRGFTRRAPENSLESILDAIDAGFQAVEIDVRETKDQVMILMHDRTVDRTMSAVGEVSSFTLEGMRRLGFRGGDDYHLPTLDEVLSVSSGRILLYIDLKSERLDLIVEQIRKHDAHDWTLLHEANPEKVFRLKEMDSGLNLHTLVRTAAELDGLLGRVTPAMVELGGVSDRSLVDYIHSKGILVEVDMMGAPDFWGGRLGIRSGWKRKLRIGADFVMSNYPDKIASLLSKQ